MSSPSENPIRIGEYLLTYLQHVYPQHLLSSIMFKITRSQWSAFKDRFIRWFIRRYGIDMTLAVQPDPSSYPDFNSFFTRALREDVRPIASDPGDIVSPADGVISQLGEIVGGRLVQAKSRWYTVADLLQGDAEQASRYDGGSFVTVYLSPRDYHRVHMPCDGVLRKMTYVPGRLFSVNQTTTRVLPELFSRNERIIAHFDTSLGPLAIIMVGAIFVGSMETVWHGLLTPPHGQKHHSWTYPPDNHLGRGEEMGRFNMGSTVIVLLPPQAATWRADLESGSTVRMGQGLTGGSGRQCGDT